MSLYRIGAIVAGSALVGLAGGYISVVSVKLWVTGMVGGRGWIAVALVVFARWAPWPALAGALLFGCIEGVVPRIAAAGIRVPQYLMLMTPYVATIAVMMWVGARNRGYLGDRGRWVSRMCGKKGDSTQLRSVSLCSERDGVK